MVRKYRDILEKMYYRAALQIRKETVKRRDRAKWVRYIIRELHSERQRYIHKVRESERYITRLLYKKDSEICIYRDKESES